MSIPGSQAVPLAGPVVDLMDHMRHKIWVDEIVEAAQKARYSSCEWSPFGVHVQFRTENRCIYCQPREPR